MNELKTTLTVVSEVDVRGRALLKLITDNIAFPGGGSYGFRPIGDNPDLRFPCIFVEPKSVTPVMATTAKYDIKWVYAIYWYVRANTPEETVRVSGWISEALTKLLSNNALGDIDGAHVPSNKYKNYANPAGGLYWLNSEMLEIRFADTYMEGEAGNTRYERAARMLFQIEDVILK